MYERTGKLIDRKFKEFFFPTIIMAASLSLSLVVDGIMVGNILGSSELAAVNLVFPINMCVTAVCGLLGVGGSTLVSVLMGARDPQRSNKVFTLSIAGLFVLGIAGFVAGLFAVDALTNLLAQGSDLMELTRIYLQVFLLGTPVMLVVMGATYFVRTDGMPKLASNVLVVANVVNLAFDFIYMYVFKMGIGGAALATITGYVAGGLMFALYAKNPRRSLKLTRVSLPDMRLYLETAGMGISSALGQVLLFAKMLCINSLLLSTAGENGVVAFSVCVSCLSMASVFISGASQSMMPLLGSFYGERDAQGVKYTIKRATTVVILACIGMTIFFEMFPALVLALYGVTEPEAVEIGVQAIRVFSVSLVGTGFSFIMMYYTQTVKMKSYSAAICFCQGFAAVVPLCYILNAMFGLVGIWSAFAIAELITAAFILLMSGHIVKKSNGRMSGIFMIEKPDESVPMLDVSIENTEQAAVALSDQVINFCEEHNAPKANLLGVLIEDMVMNMVIYNKGKNRKGYIDIIMKLYEEEAVISFKDDGAPFDPTKYAEAEADMYSISNIQMVKKIATRIEYGSVIGLNCTLVVLKI